MKRVLRVLLDSLFSTESVNSEAFGGTAHIAAAKPETYEAAGARRTGAKRKVASAKSTLQSKGFFETPLALSDGVANSKGNRSEMSTKLRA